jgi:hypothetical protein
MLSIVGTGVNFFELTKVFHFLFVYVCVGVCVYWGTSQIRELLEIVHQPGLPELENKAELESLIDVCGILVWFSCDAK